MNHVILAIILVLGELFLATAATVWYYFIRFTIEGMM